MSKKTSKGAKAQKQETVRVNLSVGEEEYQLLMFRALTRRCSAGEIITQLIAAKVKEWGLPANLIARAGVHDRLATPVYVENSAPPEPVQVAA